ncbi:phage holin family protein [Pseudoclavibacter chungangensis]|uniref:Phage holin family protein n=1 Tax=Pseudoclavibacter chungangensis TaxID=587635 RepID=A0A7J5BP54_9MICO|nr:phage holin family protein [Pseudoclavibacter chungangensis]KAB1654554.1 phage holin family protein [Pseudoclavibacter chungangensis]NYJ68212.1 hypothetical protein [Pseudoclavibacter chungangensis]
MSDHDVSHGPEPLRGPFPGVGPRLKRNNPKKSETIGTLVADTPRLFIQLLKDELEHAKRELIGKGKKAGVGAGLLAGAAFFGLTLWAVLVTAAILGLNEAFAPWLSALIVAAAFLVITALLAGLGIASLKRTGSLAPERTIASVQEDVNALKGVGQYE